MKRKIAFLLCLIMMVVMAVPAMAVNTKNTDLDHYKYMNVYSIDGEKYVKPDQPITRAEAAFAVFNLLNNNKKNVPPSGAPEFSDVPADHPYHKQITFLAHREFLTGYPDGTFQPDGYLTRAEFAEIIVRSQKLVRKENVMLAPDIGGHWAMGSINSCITRKYMNGYPDGTFQPDGTITRAEVAATMNRIYNRELDTETPIRNVTLIDNITKQYVKPYDFYQVFEDLPEDHWAYDDMMEACVSHRIFWDDIGMREIWIRELVDK